MIPTEEHKPDGLNILDAIFQEIKTLKEENKALRERLDNLTFNIPETTINAIAARVLDIHAQVLLAVTKPATPAQQEQAEKG